VSSFDYYQILVRSSKYGEAKMKRKNTVCKIHSPNWVTFDQQGQVSVSGEEYTRDLILIIIYS
jgi:hypothetical protein